MPDTPVVCNPLDLAYRYQDVRTPFAGRSVHREAADPTVVLYRDRYYMFASMTRGFWHSDDLVEWTLQPSDKIPGDRLRTRRPGGRRCAALTASRRTNGRFFRSVDPLADDFEEVDPERHSRSGTPTPVPGRRRPPLPVLGLLPQGHRSTVSSSTVRPAARSASRVAADRRRHRDPRLGANRRRLRPSRAPRAEGQGHGRRTSATRRSSRARA